MVMASVPVVTAFLVLLLPSFEHGGSSVSASKGESKARTFCARLLREANSYTSEREEMCASRVEHFDIAKRIRSACFCSSSKKKGPVKKWRKFKKKYGKVYANSTEELKACFAFQSNLRRIQLHNRLFKAGRVSYSLKITTYADLTDAEFKATNLGDGGLNTAPPTDFPKLMDVTDLPPMVDWRHQGYVTEARDQKRCGSCWAFATVGAIEGQYAKVTGKLRRLSEQQLVDCAFEGHNGCKGGSAIYAFKYIQKAGITSQEEYPYAAEYGECRYNSSMEVTRLRKHYVLPHNDEQLMQRAVATVGPIVTALFATPWMRFYGHGFYNESGCPNKPLLNHEVVIIGYGKTASGQPYWLIKNSLGKDWGENGFVKVPRGSKYCSIGAESAFPRI